MEKGLQIWGDKGRSEKSSGKSGHMVALGDTPAARPLSV